MDNKWFFTSDLHLSHTSILRGFRGTIFKNVEEHNSTIIDNLLVLPRGSNLVIAGDLFWKFSSKEVEGFFTRFKKHGISIYIIYGNHDKMSWFKYSIIRSQGYAKSMSVDGQSIFVAHYNQNVWDKSHYNSWLLFGHTHHGDSTWERAKTLSATDTYFTGKKLNINIELHDFKPWSFNEIKEYMDERPDNWDFITQKQKDEENKNSK